jgi:hypothetical protein
MSFEGKKTSIGEYVVFACLLELDCNVGELTA